VTDFGAVLVSGLGIQIQNANVHTPDFISQPVRGDGLVHRASGFHTLQVHTINFTGNVTIEGSLSRDRDAGPWTPVVMTDTVTGEAFTSLDFLFVYPVPGVPYTGKTIRINKFYSIVGQYAWLRANVVNIKTGLLDSIKLAF